MGAKAFATASISVPAPEDDPGFAGMAVKTPGTVSLPGCPPRIAK